MHARLLINVVLIIFLLNLSQASNNLKDDILDAFLNVNTNSTRYLIISLQNTECVKCKFTDVAEVDANSNVTLRIDTTYPSYYLFIRDFITNEYFCTQYQTNSIFFGENGAYLLQINDFSASNQSNATKISCMMTTVIQPDNRYIPIIVAIFIYIGAAIAFLIGNFVYKKYSESAVARDEQLMPEEDNSINVAERKANKSKNRLDSVDAFRGLCLCIMIFVNYGAGGYGFLDHARWNGLHLADLVFPCFMFIMGTSIGLSMSALASKARLPDGRINLKTSNLLYKIVKRSILLFLFGMITSNDENVSFDNVRIPGVLQRFAVSYLACAILELIHLYSRNYIYERQESFEQVTWKSNFKEILFYKMQWIVILVLTLVWLLVTFLLPVPGCPTGYLGPGGLHDNMTYQNCTGGAASYIDRHFFGTAHIYQYPTCQEVYKTVVPHDPEGLLGCLTSIVLTYLGLSAGHIFIHYKEPSKRLTHLITYGVVYGAFALVLCKASRDDGWIPINKNLWSLSFILALAAIAFTAISVSYFVIDVWRIYTGAPFIFPGKNSICVYICHIVFQPLFPIQIVVKGTHAAQLAINLYGVTLWVIVAAILYYKKIFINL